MLIFDQLKREDPKLRLLSLGVLLGVVILVIGLWWVQVVSAKRYEANMKNQSFRSVRVPALRGKILDSNNQVLAENRPRYDINVYLEDLRTQFTHEYTNTVRKEYLRTHPRTTRITTAVRSALVNQSRYNVVSNITAQIGSALHQPLVLDKERFYRHYTRQTYIPFPLFQNLTRQQSAIFAERFTGAEGIELEIQPLRLYPNGTTASHLLGYIQRHDKPQEEEDISYKYYLPDFVGRTGIEASFDTALRGKAGVKSLLVNNVGYREREEMLLWQEPGKNLTLTINLKIQRAAERALAAAQPDVRGAVVVMDVRNGDVLALVSAPAFDPNAFPVGVPPSLWEKWNDEKNSHMYNRATHAAFPPGSILKILTSIACLEAGVINPQELYRVQVDPENPPKGCIFVDRRKIRDGANAGDYDFVRAFLKSSNAYFVHYGLKAGLKKLVEVGERFHLGEMTGILPGEEVSGDYPRSKKLGDWSTGNAANLCIGQEITVTPLQMAVMTSAIANGGKLYFPRIVKNLQPADVKIETDATSFQPGSLRADLRLNPRHLNLIHKAMLADVEDPEGTGRAAAVRGFRVTGKTGTAQITEGRRVTDHITWFVSFAPFENPKYAVVVMVQSGASGGGTCAPVAGKIFNAIQALENASTNSTTVAELN